MEKASSPALSFALRGNYHHAVTGHADHIHFRIHSVFQGKSGLK